MHHNEIQLIAGRVYERAHDVQMKFFFIYEIYDVSVQQRTNASENE